MPRHLSFSLRLTLLGLLLIAGCKKKNLGSPSAIGAAPALVHTGAPLTEADGQAFGEQLEIAVASGDVEMVKALMRPAEILERSVSDLGLSAKERKDFFSMGVRFGNSFAEQFIKVVADGGNYTLVRVRIVAGRPRVIVRLMHSEGAINYHEYSLIRYPDNQIGADDVYIYLSGEPLSHTFRRFLLGFLSLQQRGFTDLKPEEKMLVEHIDDISQMTAKMRNGEPGEALAAYRKLPKELQNNKFLQLVAVQAAGAIGDDEVYLAEMERFRQNYPRDAACDLLLIDYYLLRKNYEEALQAVERLDASLGGDPYLDSLRATVLSQDGKLTEARQFADKALTNSPKLAPVYWTKLTVAALQKDHAATLETLQQIVEKIDPALDPEDLKNDDRFVEFVMTPEFAQFQKWVAARAM
jgi:tetratricopeptide (TPR) repeat protein